MARRVFLHLGMPRSGAAALSERLTLNREALARHGLTVPATRGGDHREAAIDLLEDSEQVPHSAQRDAVRGQWAALAGEVRKAPGDVVVSAELLAAARRHEVAHAMAAFAPDEVHLVVTARDLARQIPAEWIEQLRHRGRRPFRKFMSEIAAAPRTTPDLWFWRGQSLPDVLTRWGNGLPPEQIHVVTVPPPGARRELLWERFATVIGVDPATAPVLGPRVLPLGAAGAAVLRRLNRELAGRAVPAEVYDDLVRDVVARATLPAADPFVPVVVPEARWRLLERVTEEWIDWIEGAGVDVVGSLEDLRASRPGPDHVWVHPDNPPDDQVAAAAIAALGAVVTRVAPSYVSPLRRLAARVRRS